MTDTAELVREIRDRRLKFGDVKAGHYETLSDEEHELLCTALERLSAPPTPLEPVVPNWNYMARAMQRAPFFAKGTEEAIEAALTESGQERLREDVAPAAMPRAISEARAEQRERDARIADTLASVMLTEPMRGIDMDWQDISTAPKDGTSIILTPGYMADVTVGAWSYRKWIDECTAFDDGYGSIAHEEILPTHWMPLPPPPHKQGEG